MLQGKRGWVRFVPPFAEKGDACKPLEQLQEKCERFSRESASRVPLGIASKQQLRAARRFPDTVNCSRQSASKFATDGSGLAKKPPDAFASGGLWVWLSRLESSDLCGGLRLTIEEQRLADQCLDHVGIERLGHQESRFGAFAGQEAFGKGSDEDHRHGG